MYKPKPGRDHLGLGATSSGEILPLLSPGINVLTPHPRYFSFYAFLLDEFWRRPELKRSYRSFVEFFRPREFVFSLGGHLCDRPEHRAMFGIVGGSSTGPLASTDAKSYQPSVGSTNYIQSELGGYGLYYRVPMSDMGVVHLGGQGYPYPVDLPSEGLGKSLAEAFRQAVVDTEYYRTYFEHPEKPIPRDVVRDYGRIACLCQLRKEEAPDRRLIQELFVRGGLRPEDRRSTFRMFLDLATQANGTPLDVTQFRQLVYFGACEKGVRYSPRADLTSILARWRLYQAREYYAFALNHLWNHLCHWGASQGGDRHPIPLPEVWGHLAAALSFSHLSAARGLPEPDLSGESGLGELLQWITQVDHASDEGSNGYGLDAPLNEHSLYRLGRSTPASHDLAVSLALTMLALVFLRFRDPKLSFSDDWVVAEMGGSARLSLDNFLRDFRGWLGSGNATLASVASWLVKDYVVRQHLRVATSKLPDNTFRFTREGEGLLFFPRDDAVDFNDSRYDALSTAVFELGLCEDLRDPAHPLTPAGMHLLEEGDLP